MKTRYLLILASLFAASGSAVAADGAALAQKANCLGCHAEAQKKVGPSFKDIAAKYKDDKGAQATLEKKVRNGGSGSWGKTPMPPTPAAFSDADIKTMVQWVLSHK
ncbi:MAG: c-type cytochrome [Gallionellaceae bacterium]|jgi:cytochrome c|nr:c-type cytochrome [Gallionellaceae bacterium]